MNFGEAIAALKNGKRVGRAGWNGKDMWLGYVARCDIYAPEDWPELTGEPLPWIGMKTAQGDFVPWLASQTDVLAEDWEIVS